MIGEKKEKRIDSSSEKQIFALDIEKLLFYLNNCY